MILERPPTCAPARSRPTTHLHLLSLPLPSQPCVSGGTGEYLAVRQFVTDLPPSLWVSSELRLLNRPTAPVLLLLWKRDV